MKIFRIIFLLITAIFLLVNCTDDLAKIEELTQNIRVEFSKCTACHECIDEFNCPYDAILVDERTNTAYIDAENCRQCLQCINTFHCPDQAITNISDEIAPGEIKDFSAVSDTLGKLEINFIAPGDDDTLGIAYRYEFSLKDQNGQTIQTDFEVPLPNKAGYEECWIFNDLPPEELITVNLQAFDETNRFSGKICAEIMIEGEYHDEIPPSAISDLNSNSYEDSLELIWTAVGDDEMNGTAERYEIRYSESEIDEETWNSAVIYENDLVPAESGISERLIIQNIPQQIKYNFAIEVFDEENNPSGISNITNASIIGDLIPPAAISDLNSNSYEDSLELIWTAVGDDEMNGTAERYEIRYNESEIDEDTWNSAVIYENDLVPAESGISERLIIQNIPQQIKYNFAIEVFDEENNPSGISNITNASIIGDLIPPAEVMDLNVVSTTPNSVLLSWTAVGDNENTGTADAYVIKIHTQEITENNWNDIPEIEQDLNPLSNGEIESFLVESLEPVTGYFAAVKVLDEAHNFSGLSNVVHCETTEIPDTIPPAQITDLAAIPTETEIELTWTAPGDDEDEGTAYQYHLLISNEEITESNCENCEELPDPPIPLSAGTLQNYFVDALEVEQDYYFAIKAEDESNNLSQLSNCLQTALLEDVIPPAQIDDLSALASDDVIILSWSAVGDNGMDGVASAYEIRFSQDEISETNWLEAEILPNPPQPGFPGNSETYSTTDLTPGIDYYFALKAMDENENYSQISNNAQAVIILDDIPPAAVSDLSVREEFNIFSFRLYLDWTAPGNDNNEGTADNYDIRFSNFPLNENNWDSAISISNAPDPGVAGTSQSCQITGLAGGTIYYFAIKTYDENDNESPISNSPGGKIVYQINHSACHDCSNCINDCPENAIFDAGPYKSIDPDICLACGDCSCPWYLIKLAVVSY